MFTSIRHFAVAACRRLVAAAGVAALCIGTASLAAPTAVLHERVTVDAAQWRLADVADISGVAEPVARAIGQQIVWPSPAPCHSARVSRSLIEKRLRALLQSEAVPVELAGAWQVDIERRCQRLDATTLQGVAREALASWLSSRSERFEIDSAPTPDRLDLPLGRVALVARALPADEALSSRMNVWVDIGVDDNFVRSVPIAFQVHAFRGAWVATRDARAGESPASAALERRETDVADVHPGALDDVPAYARLKRPLLSGQVLTRLHVETLPPVQRGALVTVRSALGAIDIEARGEALQDGRPGQLVWVRLATSTGPVHTRVVGAGIVEVLHE